MYLLVLTFLLYVGSTRQTVPALFVDYRTLAAILGIPSVYQGLSAGSQLYGMCSLTGPLLL